LVEGLTTRHCDKKKSLIRNVTQKFGLPGPCEKCNEF